MSEALESVATATTAIGEIASATGWKWPWLVGMFVAGAVFHATAWPMIRAKLPFLKK